MQTFEMEDLIPLVAQLTKQYTSNESTSISYDKARQLMGAVIYCIQEYETRMEIPQKQALIFPEKPTALEAYEAGYQLVLEKFERTKSLFSELSVSFCSYGNQNYEDTVINGITGFLKWYDAKYNPQNHILTLDYPTLKPLDTLCGVDAIYEYIKYIQLEQLFLSKLPKDYVCGILFSFHHNYKELFINICNVVLRNLLGAMILGARPKKPDSSPNTYKKMETFIQGYSQKELEEKLLDLLRTLIATHYEENEALLEYLGADMSDYSFELKNAVTHHCLDAILIL